MPVKFAVGDTVRVLAPAYTRVNGLTATVTKVVESWAITASGHSQLLHLKLPDGVWSLWWNTEVELIDPFDHWVAEVRSAAKAG